MATCKQETVFRSLELPDEFDDLAGLLQSDLKAIVSLLTQRANERLLLTRRETRDLREIRDLQLRIRRRLGPDQLRPVGDGFLHAGPGGLGPRDHRA